MSPRKKTHHQTGLQPQNKESCRTGTRLTKSRDRHSESYEFAPIGYVSLDDGGTILESNLTAATMLGVERQALLGVKFSKFVMPESREEWHLQRQSAFSSQAKQLYEIELRRAGGTRLTARLEGVVSGSEDDRRYRVALIDITAQKAAEEALRELNKDLERRLAQEATQIRLQGEVIAQLDEGVIIARGSDWLSSNVLFVNDALCRITGYTAKELIGRPRSILLGARTQRHILNRIQRELSNSEVCHADLIQHRKDGSPYHAVVSIKPGLDQQSGLTTFVSVHRNVAERKQTDRQLDQYMKDLKTMAAEVMLAEERERRRIAEDLHAGPAQAIVRARIMLDQLSIVEPEAKQVCAILKEMGGMMNRVIFELSPVVLRTLGLRHAVRSLAADMLQRYGLSVLVDDDSRDIVLDEPVELVLFWSVRELLCNIVKHAETARAALLFRRVDHTLQIVVEDRGKGFDQAEQSGLVESGRLGLFCIRQRMEHFGGTLDIRTTPGKGATATLKAPLASGNAEAVPGSPDEYSE